MTPEAIDNIRNWIICWARSPTECMSSLYGWHWLHLWWRNFPPRELAILLLASLFFFISLVKKFNNSLASKAYLLALPSLVGLIFWFITAPDIRFLGSIPYILISCSLLSIAPLLEKNQFFWVVIKKIQRHFLISFFLLSSIAVPLRFPISPIKRIFTEGFQPIRTVPTIEYRTHSGLTVYIPQQSGLCFDAQLPCTPYSNPNLQLETRATYPHSFFSVK